LSWTTSPIAYTCGTFVCSSRFGILPDLPSATPAAARFSLPVSATRPIAASTVSKTSVVSAPVPASAHVTESRPLSSFSILVGFAGCTNLMPCARLNRGGGGRGSAACERDVLSVQGHAHVLANLLGDRLVKAAEEDGAHEDRRVEAEARKEAAALERNVRRADDERAARLRGRKGRG
jgi:hypothetical protein